MKKLAFALIACLAFLPSLYATQPSLSQSLLECEAIISAIKHDPNFENIIASNECIVEIKRLFTEVPEIEDINNIIRYNIVTLPSAKADEADSSFTQKVIDKAHNLYKKIPDIKKSYPYNNYLVKLYVESNLEDGSSIVTVTEMTKIDFSKIKHTKPKKQQDARK